MIKTKVTFLEGRLLSSQSEQSEKFSKSPGWYGMVLWYGLIIIPACNGQWR